MEESNLDDLYQQKLKEFSQQPEAHVWERIEATLDKKRKKRALPIWWYVGGAAAVLLMGLFLINPFTLDETLNQNPVSNAQQQPEQTSQQDGEVINTKILPEETTKIAGTEENTHDSDENNNLQQGNQERGNALPQNKASLTVAASNRAQRKSKSDAVSERDNQFVSPLKDAIAQNNGEKPTERQDSPTLVDKTNQQESILSNKAQEDEKKSVFDVLQEQEEEALADSQPRGKWSLGPSIAPVYYNAFGEGSPIHSMFSGNAKSGNINLSYGLSVSYELTNKLSVRSGVHRVDYGYDTEQITFSSSFGLSTEGLFENIDYTLSSRTIVVENQSKPQTFNDVETANTPTFDGRMKQQLGYVEIPLELSYTLVDKKFGINLIGGVSSLFLIDNSISLESEGLVTEVGEANNVNNTNFSTNVGLGLNYNFSEKVQFNLEPMFKYQLSTFSDSAGSFAPYSVGVYSGLRFKF